MKIWKLVTLLMVCFLFSFCTKHEKIDTETIMAWQTINSENDVFKNLTQMENELADIKKLIDTQNNDELANALKIQYDEQLINIQNEEKRVLLMQLKIETASTKTITTLIKKY